jgi:hypothetical protein
MPLMLSVCWAGPAGACKVCRQSRQNLQTLVNKITIRNWWNAIY